MEQEIRCKEDLKVEDCDYVARGESPGEVVEKMVAHLRDEHNLDMPEPEVILEGDVREGAMGDDVEKGVEVIVRRLYEALDLQPREGELDAEPSPGNIRTP